YQVATLDSDLLVRTTLDVLAEEDRVGKAALCAAVATEVAARMVGFLDARILGGKHRTWRQLSTTKKLRQTQFPPPPLPPASHTRLAVAAPHREESNVKSAGRKAARR